MGRHSMTPAAMNIYRHQTATAPTFTMPQRKTCPCCKVSRSILQFDDGKRFCRKCRGK